MYRMETFVTAEIQDVIRTLTKQYAC